MKGRGAQRIHGIGGRPPADRLPARMPRTGRRQLTVTLTDEEAEALERVRVREAARSWGEVIRLLIQRARRRETAPQEP